MKELTEFMKKVGFKKDNFTFIPCSGLHGENLKERTKKIPWYNGPSVIEHLDTMKAAKRPIDSPFRLSISDIYKSQTTGLTAAGKIESGTISVNDKVLIMPIRELCTIKQIYRHKEAVKTAYAGDNVDLSLAGVDMTHLRYSICYI